MTDPNAQPPHVDGRPDTWPDRLPDRMEHAPWPVSPLWIVDAMQHAVALSFRSCLGATQTASEAMATELRPTLERIAKRFLQQAQWDAELAHYSRVAAIRDAEAQAQAAGPPDWPDTARIVVTRDAEALERLRAVD